MTRLAGLLLLVGAALAVCFPLDNTDIWWHLAAGRRMLETGGFLRHDPFSISAHGAAWTNLHWLLQVGAYGLHSLGGPAAIVLGKCAIVALGAWVLLRAVETTDPEVQSAFRPLTVVVLLAACLAGRQLMLARPVILSLLLLASHLYLLERFARQRRPSLLWWLVPGQILWSNVQPLFPLGLVLLLCFLAAELLAACSHAPGPGRFRTSGWLSLSLLALIAGSLVTPYGLEGLLLPFKLLFRIDPASSSLFAHQVSENLAPWLLERRVGAGGLDAASAASSVAAFKWIAALVFASFLLSWRRVRMRHLLIVLAFWGLALMANRNIVLFYWLAAPVLALNLSVWLSESGPRWLPGPWRHRLRQLASSPWFAVVGFALISAPLASAFAAQSSLRQVAPFRVPSTSLASLQAHPVPGPVFSSVRYGGYLIWQLRPELERSGWQTYVDGRLVLRTGQQFADYLAVLDQPARFDALQRVQGFQAVVLPSSAPDRYRPLIKQLYVDLNWRLAATDGSELLFLRREQFDQPGLDLSSRQVVEPIVAGLGERFAGFEAQHQRAVLNLGALLALLEHRDLAQEVLAGLDLAEARSLRARIAYLDGNRAQARAMAQDLFQERPDDAANLILLAMIALDRGEDSAAIDWLERLLKRDPFHVEARRLLEALADRETGLQSQDAADLR